MSVLELLGGRLAYVAPVALVVAGGCLLSRDIRPPARPLRAGTLCLSVALTLAFAAGTLGLGPGATPAAHFWSAATLRARGGVLGGMEFWAAKHLLSTGGADVLAVFLLIAGVILLSGATFASVVMASRRHATAALRHTDIRSATRRAEAMAARARVSRASAPSERARDEATDFDPYDGGHAGSDPFVDFDPVTEQLDAVPEFTAGRIAGGEPDDPSVTAYEADEGSDRSGTGRGHGRGGRRDRRIRRDPGRRPDSDNDAPFPSDESDEVDDELGAVLPAEEEDGTGGPRRTVDASELTPAGRYRASVTDDPHSSGAAPTRAS